MPRPELSLVIPIFNEEEVLPQLDERLRGLLEKISTDTEVVFIDDGSRDRSFELLRAMATKERRYRVISFARNFGHQRAITCGMDRARGRAVVIMDADLQDPPEVVVEMVRRWKAGYHVVYGRRRSREGESWFKLLTASLFYRFFAALIPIDVPLDAGDFRLLDRRVILTLRALRETHRFIRGMVSWVGFKQTAVEYDRKARAAGTTKYPLRKMVAFALDAIASFSILPLRMATYLGIAMGTFSVLCGVAAVIVKLVGSTVPGWTTIVLLVSFLFSVQFLMTGVLGEYVGRIYEQVKGRPLYVVGETLNFQRKDKRKSARQTQGFGDAAVPTPETSRAEPTTPRVAVAVSAYAKTSVADHPFVPPMPDASPASARFSLTPTPSRPSTDRPPPGAAVAPPALGSSPTVTDMAPPSSRRPDMMPLSSRRPGATPLPPHRPPMSSRRPDVEADPKSDEPPISEALTARSPSGASPTALPTASPPDAAKGDSGSD